ncbi:MAG TPA: helix-turn-helix domain-containing protein [Pyrinomonadaceae bacterium]|jgi:transcriptional regulator with XRE-family HTH domain
MTKAEFKERRERLGMTQAKFADTLKVSLSIISKYETGASDIPHYFELIFEALEARQIKKLQSPIEK